MYKRSFSGPYLLCIHPKVSELLLEELHEGICGSHIRGRSLSHQTITQDYWWPNMQKEVQEYVKKCDQCQKYAPNIHQLGGVFNPLSSPGHLPNGAETLLALFPRQWGIRDICWSARITSLNRLKLSPWQISGTWMPRNSFRKTLSHGSDSLVLSSRTMAFSLITNLSRDTVVT